MSDGFDIINEVRTHYVALGTSVQEDWSLDACYVSRDQALIIIISEVYEFLLFVFFGIVDVRGSTSVIPLAFQRVEFSANSDFVNEINTDIGGFPPQNSQIPAQIDCKFGFSGVGGIAFAFDLVKQIRDCFNIFYNIEFDVPIERDSCPRWMANRLLGASKGSLPSN